MDQEMKDNLQDLRDIRKQMDQYYGIGQEYIRKEQIFERYEKAKKKWDLELVKCRKRIRITWLLIRKCPEKCRRKMGRLYTIYHT